SEAFGAQIVYYSNSAKFKQKFKLKKPDQPATVAAEFTYQTCDDRVCLAPNTLEFAKKVTPDGNVAATEVPVTAPEITQDTASTEKDTIAATVSGQANSTTFAQLDPKKLKIESLDFNNPLTDCGEEKQEKSDNYLNYLFQGLQVGLIAYLATCLLTLYQFTVS